MVEPAADDANRDIGGQTDGQPEGATARLLAELRLANQQLLEASLWEQTLAQAATAIAREVFLHGVVAAAVDQTFETLGALTASVFLADEARRELRLAGQRNLPPEVLGRLAEVSFDTPFLAARAAGSRRPQVIDDTAALDPSLTLAHEIGARAGIRSVVSVPLIAFGRLVGVLTYGLPQPHPFSARELTAITSIADVFAVGIANAQTYERERRLRAEMEAVHQAALAIASEIDLHAVLQTIVDQARLITGAECAALGIVADPSRAFDPWVFSGVTAEQAADLGEFPRPVGTLGVVAREGQVLRVRDVRRHPAFVGFPPHHPAITSLLGVPIRYQEQSVGNLYLANKVAAEEFTEEDQRGVELLAAHAGIAIVVLQDISALKELERMREEWISIIAHDLRQPVTVISAAASALQRIAEWQADPRTRRIIEHVRTAARSLSRMIVDLLDASRIEARRLTLDRQSVSLAALVQDVVERTEDATRGHPVRVELKGPIPPLVADPGRVEQVLGNLLSNAAKYGYPESEIVVEVVPRADEVEVSVTNRGEGMAPEDLATLFSRFHRTPQAMAGPVPGLGLGLYIARGLVGAHGGRIWAESTPRQTTTFHFTLPAEQDLGVPPST